MKNEIPDSWTGVSDLSPWQSYTNLFGVWRISCGCELKNLNCKFNWIIDNQNDVLGP